MSIDGGTPFPNLNVWEAKLESNQYARIWWLNFQFDKKHANLPHDVVDKFERELSEAVQSSGPAVTPLEIIERIIGREEAAYTKKSQRRPLSVSLCSRVIDVETYVGYYIHENWFILKGLRDADLVARAARAWEELDDISPTYHNDRQMRGKREFFWVTLTDRLEEIESRCMADGSCTLEEARAGEICNCLGFSWTESGARLLRINIPRGALSDADVYAPTTLDADPHVPAFAPSRDGSGVGWTLNLKTLAQGVEELIAEPIPFGRNLEVRKIGEVRDAPRVNLNDFEERARRLAGE
jgi:hypothetical protein